MLRTVIDRHERHDDRPRIAINTRVMLVHRALLASVINAIVLINTF